jgi:hypothetical protein
LRGGSIHIEAYLAIQNEEPDHTAAGGEFFSFTDRENAGSGCRIENAMQLLGVPLDYDGRAGTSQRLVPLDAENGHWSFSDRLRLEKQLGGVRRGAFSDNQDDERIFGARGSIHRPLDEPEKIVDEHRLDLRFAHWSLRFYANANQQRCDNEKAFNNGASL